MHVAFDGGQTSDAGILLLAAVEQRLGIAARLANCIEDPRAPERVRHGLAEMIRYRALLIAARYPDGNDGVRARHGRFYGDSAGFAIGEGQAGSRWRSGV